jgi:hypothetical protein
VLDRAYFEQLRESIFGGEAILGSLGCLNYLRSKLTCRCGPKLYSERMHRSYDNLDLAKNGFVEYCRGID